MDWRKVLDLKNLEIKTNLYAVAKDVALRKFDDKKDKFEIIGELHWILAKAIDEAEYIHTMKNLKTEK